MSGLIINVPGDEGTDNEMPAVFRQATADAQTLISSDDEDSENVSSSHLPSQKTRKTWMERRKEARERKKVQKQLNHA
eukprot:m.98601 g.98601  ORF g.98601 m.98601 type:complete len:78 (-) comp15284_c0_seq4:194-427(-)